MTILQAGAPIAAFATQKEIALLVYLVCTGRSHSREALSDLLWDDRSYEQASANLRTTLSRLKRRLAPYLIVTRKTVAFEPASPYTLDTATFQAHLVAFQGAPEPGGLSWAAVTELDQTLQLYCGDFLDAFHIRGARGFDEWATIERESLRQQMIAGLYRLLGYHTQHGHYADDKAITARLLALDLLDEEAHRHMMRVLALHGQRSAALAQYETCRFALDAELGVAPEPATTALREQIRAGAVPDMLIERQADQASAALPLQQTASLSPTQQIAGAPQHNLLQEITPFFGRETELARLCDKLRDPACRLVTLVGPGGSGKTRLALTVAAHALADYQHGAWFVPLEHQPNISLAQTAQIIRLPASTPAHENAGTAVLSSRFSALSSRAVASDTASQTLRRSLPDRFAHADTEYVADALADLQSANLPASDRPPPSVLVTAIAAALGFTASRPGELHAQLLGYLRDKQLLLLLDTMEHRLDEAGFIIELLQSAPNVTVLVTSREPLNFQAECVLRLDGLATPTTADAPAAASYSSVQLFAERAARNEPGFQLSASNLPDVVRICQLVQGLPLAIELAATWAKQLSVSDIAAATACDPTFLTTSLRDLPARHRSMRTVFEASWRLLSRIEQVTFAQVAVFDGRFSQAAALEVAEAAPAALAALVDKSLLLQTEHAWYTIDELLRQFALEKLNVLTLTGGVSEPTLRARYSAYLRCAAQQAQKLNE